MMSAFANLRPGDLCYGHNEKTGITAQRVISVQLTYIDNNPTGANYE